jgi:FMN reductase
LRRALDDALGRAGPANDVEISLIDLAEAQVAFADGRSPDTLGDDTASVVRSIVAADAVIFATPVYRGSLTGSLKNLLDHLPVEALEGKAIGIVSMGATDHHYLGAERHLRDILAFFGAVVAPVAVYLTAADFADGIPSPRVATHLDALAANVIQTARALPPPPADLRPLAASPRNTASDVRSHE